MLLKARHQTLYLIVIALLFAQQVQFIHADQEEEIGMKHEPAPPSATPIVGNLQEQLKFDDNDRLVKHYLVYPANDILKGCPAETRDNPEYEKAGLVGDALEIVFPEYDSEEEPTKCLAAWLEKGVARHLAGYTMPHFQYNGLSPEDRGDPARHFENWITEYATKVEVCLLNYYSRRNVVNLYWINHRGGEDLTLEIKFGDKNTKCFSSFLGHRFRAYGKNDEEDSEYTLIDEFTVEYVLVKGFGESPVHNNYGKTSRDFEKSIESTLRSEWTRHNIPKRTFSPLGFAKGRLPNDVFGSLGAFYYNNRAHKVREEWDGKGHFVNWWETDVFFIQIPWSMKSSYQERLLSLVEQWTGVPVEQSVMNGLGQYQSGARLLTHVDRLKTHAVSLIINIAQGSNLTQDWPVEVFDHAGRLHEVVMEPGDIVSYESAKNFLVEIVLFQGRLHTM